MTTPRAVRNYQSFYGINTIRGLVSRWAPEHENPTDSYSDYIATRIGIDENQPIDFREYLFSILKSMARFESGREWSDSQVLAGIEMS